MLKVPSLPEDLNPTGEYPHTQKYNSSLLEVDNISLVVLLVLKTLSSKYDEAAAQWPMVLVFV